MERVTATIGSTWQTARDKLAHGLELAPTLAGLEASILLAKAIAQDRAYLLAHADDALNAEHDAAFEALLKRRLAGEPMAYLLGRREFYGLDFVVSPAVLIPRPETELLVDTALELIPPQGAYRVLDLGTGSGAIALSLAKHRPRAEFTAVDSSAAALAVAKQNALHLSVANVEFVQSDWFSAVNEAQPYQLIIANPPYIAADDPHTQRGDLRFEPKAALISGADGLDAISHIVVKAPAFLVKDGQLLFEHGFTQKEACLALLQRHGYRVKRALNDLGGQPRAILSRYTSPA